MKSDRTMPSSPNSPGLLEFDRLYAGDCLELFPRVASGSIDLVFADPPFNIGYDYDIYDDRREAEAYLNWTRSWGREVVRTLKRDGTFWLAIGDEYAAELKILFHRELGLSLRSWVIWYYTFGVHCTRKFSRSHAHLFYFVKDPKRFTFNDQSIRVPSGPPPRRHLDPPPARRSGRVRTRERHLVPSPRLWHLQGARRLARLPDARAALGPDRPRLLKRR
jgi:DNA modification methylase